MMDGGNGIDGETLLTWLDPVEMGGTLLLEAVGVTLWPGSTGILAGLFVGLETQASCIAGFQATAQPGTGAMTLQPMIQGLRRAQRMQSIRPTNIRCACGCIALSTSGQQASIAPLEIAVRFAGGGLDTGSGQATDGDSGVC